MNKNEFSLKKSYKNKMEKTIIIGKKEMKYTVKDNIFSLPKLTIVDKLQHISYWIIFVQDENKIIRKSYQEGGKVREFPSVECSGKNIGKKNETTNHQQALLEAHSLWLKKQDQGYKIATPVEEPDDSQQAEKPSKDPVLLPMLANRYDQRKKHLQIPFAISRKLDGIRVMIRQNKRKEVQLFSRLNKEFSFMDGIRMSLKLLLRQHPTIMIDGELYSHELPFNAISGAVRAKKTKSKYDDQIELWIFDLIDMKNEKTQKMRYEDRMRLLKELEQAYSCCGGNNNLKFVYYDVCNDHTEVEKFHSQYVAEGFEGAICRNFSGPYLFKNRSNDLLKHKAFEDAEFVITGAKPGIGTEKGAVVFECTCAAGKFDVRPRGSIDKRRQLYLSKDKYIGKYLTVRYQAPTNDADREIDTGIPRFPVGIDIRDYE